MYTLGVTLDILYAAIEGLIAIKACPFARKGVAFTAKDESIVRLVGPIAVKSGVHERMRVVFAVIEGEHAAIGGHNVAKRLSLAAIEAHEAAIEASIAAIDASITAKSKLNAAIIREAV